MPQVFIPKWLHVWMTVKQGSERYHFNYSYSSDLVAPTDADLLSWVTGWYNIVAPGLSNILHGSCVMESATVRVMYDATGHEITYVPSSPVAGARAGDPEPANVAGTLSFVPGAVGRGVRGRMYISGYSDTDIASQVITSAIVTTMASIASAMRTYTGGSPIFASSVIASRAHLLLRPILASVVTNQVNNQIRRLIGHRRHKRHTGP